MAGCHLIDPDTDEYNASYVRRLLPERPSVLVTLAHREQGLVTAPGNPLILSDVTDLARGDVRFTARNPGSGTRIWADKQLRKAGVDLETVYAGASVATTHGAAAETVARGDADATIAIRSAAEDLGLGFVPLFHERYDLVIPLEHLEDPGIARVVDQMHTRAFREKVGSMAGYDPTHTGDVERIAV
jgi:putative molybdopterin biosynthesis protein